MKRYLKDPDATLDYEFGFVDFLAGGDSIASYEVFPDAGITVDSHSQASGVVTVWLSGGSLGREYAVTVRVTTAGGRVDDLSIVVMVRQQ